jgi:hypothetical protein
MCPDNPEYIGKENSGCVQIIQNTLEKKILDMSRKEDNRPQWNFGRQP